MNAYQRQQGDFEIRILPDGRLVMLAPDEALIAMAEQIQNQTPQSDNNSKQENNDVSKQH
ncbi:MAG TPA: hypothetical protein PKB02_12265 [Anaerohalosphaeraceae bacterium]|nr:hypothetical protein [Anaerohalosphaeraceae bacterium]